MITTDAPTTMHLTEEDCKNIRALLPYDWRIQFAEETGLTPRQVSEVFYLRTTNPDWNKKVWFMIMNILIQLDQDDLNEVIAKIKKRITITNVGR